MKSLDGLAWQAGDWLLMCDIADFKRRNFHLGFERGDADIHLFDGFLKETVGAERARMIGGGRWVAVVAPDFDVRPLIDRYGCEEPIEVHYEVDAILNGHAHHTRLWTWRGVLRRAIRCASAPIEEGLEPTTESLLDVIYRQRVDTPPGGPLDGSGWRCDWGMRPPDPARCPLCDSDALTIEGGACDVEEMHCTACGADLDFRFKTDLV